VKKDTLIPLQGVYGGCNVSTSLSIDQPPSWFSLISSTPQTIGGFVSSSWFVYNGVGPMDTAVSLSDLASVPLSAFRSMILLNNGGQGSVSKRSRTRMDRWVAHRSTITVCLIGGVGGVVSVYQQSLFSRGVLNFIRSFMHHSMQAWNYNKCMSD